VGEETGAVFQEKGMVGGEKIKKEKRRRKLKKKSKKNEKKREKTKPLKIHGKNQGKKGVSKKNVFEKKKKKIRKEPCLGWGLGGGPRKNKNDKCVPKKRNGDARPRKHTHPLQQKHRAKKNEKFKTKI